MFYINGSYVEEEHAKISVLDLGVLRGYGVFDYLRTYGGKRFHLKDHLLRLKYSAEYIGIALPHTLEEIEAIVDKLLAERKCDEASIKIIVTGGVSPDHMTPPKKATLIAHVYPFKPFPVAFYQQGIKVTTTSLYRTVPMCKSLQYIPAIMALEKGRLKNASEALYLNKRREILEAMTCNFFAFKKGVLITPESDEILLGITRSVIFNLAKGVFPIEIRTIPYDEIGEFDETFITSSAREIMPVTAIDEQMIGKGKVGEQTLQLMKLFADYTRGQEWPLLNIHRYL